jgi:hypothetical protein
MYYDSYEDLINQKSDKYLELLEKVKYLSVDDVMDPKVKLEDLIKFHPSLDTDNHLTYLMLIHLRPDLSETDKIHYQKMALIKRALTKRDYEKQYKLFEIANYQVL